MPTDTTPEALTHGVAIRGEYGVTCSCAAILDWPAGWARGETAANRLVELHAGECLSCHRPWFAARPSPDSGPALALLDVIDGIVDDTHPEGDGCPLCTALDDLREMLEAQP